MPELTNLEIQFQYRTEGLKKVKELAEAFENVVQGTKQVDEKVDEINKSLNRIKSGVEGLLGTFAEPFMKWYGTVKDLHSIYKGLKTKAELSDVSKDKAATEQEKLQAKELDIQKRNKILQVKIFKDRFNLFKQDKKISKNLFVYGLSVLGVAGAYALWGPIPAIILGVATALTFMGLTLNKVALITRYIVPGVMAAAAIYALLNWDSIKAFFDSITGGSQQTSQEAQDIWAFGLQTIDDAAIATQLSATQAVNAMAQGTQGLMNSMTQIAETVISVQIPQIMENGVVSANDATQKWYNSIANTIGAGSAIIADEFKNAAVSVLVYGKALEGIITISKFAYDAVSKLVAAYGELRGGAGRGVPTVSTGPLSPEARKEYYTTTGAMIGLPAGPHGVVAGATVGAYIAETEERQERLMKSPFMGELIRTAAATELDPFALYGEAAKYAWSEYGQTGLQSRGGLAILHEGEEIMSGDNKNINLSLKLNLKATTPTNFTDGDLRELSRRVSDFRTKELYRRQTTIL